MNAAMKVMFVKNGSKLKLHVFLYCSHITTLKIDQKPPAPCNDSVGNPTIWNHGYSEMAGHRNK